MAPPIVSAFAVLFNAVVVILSLPELPRATVPLTVWAALKVTPALLLRVRLLMVAGKPFPVACADVPV